MTSNNGGGRECDIDFPRVRSLSELKKKCIENGIKNTTEYKARYKDIPGLVANPERVFRREWVSYNDLFDIPAIKPYGLLKKEAAAKTECNT